MAGTGVGGAGLIELSLFLSGAKGGNGYCVSVGGGRRNGFWYTSCFFSYVNVVNYWEVALYLSDCILI